MEKVLNQIPQQLLHKEDTPPTPPNEPKTSESDKTVVVSAGARFIKVDASDTKTKLRGNFQDLCR